MINPNFSNVAESDNLRSTYIFENVFQKNNLNQDKSNSSGSIPKQLIQYWDDQLIPEDVKKVMASWENSEIPTIVYNQKSAKEFISEYFEREFVNAFDKCIHPAMRADYFRLCYLYLNGGFYVDIDDKYNNISLGSLFKNNNLKVHPLCYDLSKDKMVDINTFYYTSNINSDFIYYVNNDPILSPAKHPIIKLALERATFNLLSKKTDLKNIQSVAGPGNLSASIVQYFHTNEDSKRCVNFEIISNWDDIATPQWNLDYRKDERNWRIWSGDFM